MREKERRQSIDGARGSAGTSTSRRCLLRWSAATPVDLLSRSRRLTPCRCDGLKTEAAPAGTVARRTIFEGITGNFSGLGTTMMEEDNGNVTGFLKPTTSSNEDLSEYTDADESISAPTEFLAEFLSALMLKDYATSLKYCKLILQYEPNNATAKEFYPLILEKLQHTTSDGGSSNDNESEEDESECSSSNSVDSENTSSEESSEVQEEEEYGAEVGQSSGDKQSKASSQGDGTTGSYSSLEDDEAEEVDQLAALVSRYQIDNVNLGNGNKIYNTDLSTSANNLQTKMSSVKTAQFPFGTGSDSESPTEPVTQQTVAMLRARVVPNNM